jgi:hypothetical protein
LTIWATGYAWAAGAPSDAPGADLPVCVIGGYELLDIDVPQGFIASDYTWNGVSLLLKAPPASEGGRPMSPRATTTEEKERQFVDMRVPLSWLLSSAATIVFTLGATLWNIAGQSNKLDQLIITNQKLEKRLDDRDTRIDGLRDKIFGLERANDNLTLRIDTLERAKK